MTDKERRPVTRTPPNTEPNCKPESNGDGNGREPHPLRAALDELGGNLNDWTVLAPQRDPFRFDSPTYHRDGQWLANRIATLRLSLPIHPRGLHYVLVSGEVTKPNGLPYTNTDLDWLWLDEKVIKAARWLGYVPFDQITDQRNAEPVLRLWTPPQPEAFVRVDFEVYLPAAEDLHPRVGLADFSESQRYHLVFVGEKSSLETVLGPIAESHQADLYLPTGEISDYHIHRIAKHAAIDGRPMVVLYFADCDPAGYQMGISLSRKLQALTVIEFPGPECELHRVALTPDQVRQYGLPSSPPKDTEKRADKWTAAMGVAQTEVDALATLQPDLLRELARDAIEPFYDRTLSRRVNEVRADWLERAQAALDGQSGGDLDRLREDANAALDQKYDEIEAILDTVRVDADQFDLPELPEIPVAELNGDRPEPLFDSRWSFAEQTRRLIASKRYEQ